MTDQPTAFAAACARIDAGADPAAEASALIDTMTLEEKLGCLDGDTDFWTGLVDMGAGGYHDHPWPAAVVDRLGIPGIQFADGPRGCVVGPATCFPVAMARGATFDPGLEERIGEAIGRELRAVGATFTGAVCINLLRHPGWGRAQETYGEDPVHVGVMGAAFTVGLQRHVMACMKHFALNSMENARFSVDVTCDERALHEVYLPHFRQVADAGAAAVMSAYNAVNGAWAGDSHALLTDILRSEWGFDGFVITDFVFGLRDPIGSIAAGCDIEMPFRQQRAQVLAEAVADGRLAIDDVDRAVGNIVTTLLRFRHVFAPGPDEAVLASAPHRALAREAATASAVMLRNDGALPVDPGALRRVAVLGRLAAVANLGDGGSSAVYPPEVVTPLDGLRSRLPDVDVVHADDDAAVADGADLTVVVVGYTRDDEGEYLGPTTPELFGLFPPRPEVVAAPPEPRRPRRERAHQDRSFSTGGDRRSLELSAADAELIAAAVGASSGPVVVVVMAGSAVVMPWLETVDGVIQCWYPGMEGGHALAEIICGDVEPGGRLPFAVPRSDDDLVHFDPDATAETYGLLHGQWFLDGNGVAAHLPFGFGLGYTSFELGDPELIGGDRLVVEVRNRGERPGSTVVFVFGGLPGSAHDRPVRRLVGFGRVLVGPRATRRVEIPVDWRALDLRLDGAWYTEPGDYRLEVGFDAGDRAHSMHVTR